MKRQSLLKKTGAFILTLCMILTMMAGVIPAQVQAAEGDSHTVYFKNSESWETVGAYIWCDRGGEPLGGWPGVDATAATEVGDDWMKVTVSFAAPYHIIFFNKAADGERVDVTIEGTDKVYTVLGSDKAYATKEEAEASLSAVTYDLYFLNTNGWAGVGAHAYYENAEGVTVTPMGSWGSAIGTAATELGENWVKFSATQTPPYSVIFYNTADDTQRIELYIDAAEKIYVTANAQAYTSQAAAEVAMGVAQTYPVYFLNSNEWASVGAYAYYKTEAGETLEPLGSWGTTTATAATELGGNWVQVSATQAPPYSVIFYNTADDTQRVEMYLDAADKTYVTVNAEAFTTQADAEASLNPDTPDPVTYDLYFLNSGEWASVGAYAYYKTEAGETLEPLGSWGTTTATAATELGGNWVQVSATQEPPYSVIFFNTADDTQRAELYIDAADKVYVTVNAKAFASQAEAEASLNPEEPEVTYDLYFLNAYDWAEVGAYAYYTDGTNVEPLGSWGTSIATAATELGGKWMQVSATQALPYNVIFYNTANDQERVEYYIDSADKIYATVKNVAFASQAEAEAWNDSGVELWDMTLGDDLGVNFYLHVDSTLAANTVVTIKVAGEEYCKKPLTEVTANADGYYAFSVDMAAAQMTEEVTVELTVGESNLYYNTFTVRDYADRILAGDYSDETKALVRQMVEYGAAAQTYFAYNTESLANAGMEATEQVAVPETATTEMSVSGELEGISYYGATLLFTSKTAVRYYFTVSGSIDNYTFTVGEKSYTPVAKDGMYYVEIADINPQALDSAITLTVNGELSVTYSPMNYIVRMSANGSTELKALLQAMYNYYLAACKV